MSTNYETIKNAIKNKKIIKARYGGYEREMCPHVIGTNKEGKEQALFYQFGGYSSKGMITSDSNANWRCISTDGLENIRVEDGTWHTGSNHSTEQTCVANIDLEVS